MIEAAHNQVGVEDQLQRILAAQTRRSRVMSALAILPILAVLAGEVRPMALVVWAGMTSFEALIYIAWSLPGATRVGAGTTDANWSRRAPLHAIAFGLVWGSLPLLTLEPGRPMALWLTLIISLAVLTLYVVSTASSRRQFALGAGPIIGQFALAIWISDDAPARMAVLALGYAAVAVGVHAALRRHLVESVESQRVAESLADTLNSFLADRDPTTQLLNRRSFISRLDAILATHSAATVTVEVGNVRRLTAMNELYGEQFGDALIAHVGARLAAVEQQGGLAARLSGDEFVIATFPGSAAPPERPSIRALAAGPFAWHDRTAMIDFATAIVEPRSLSTGAEDLLAEAVFELRSGRRRQSVPGANRASDTVHSRRELVDELRTGLRGAGVQPWFQPIVDATTREVIAWEALVRWPHPSLGLITPDRFLPLCEMANLNAELLELLLQDSISFLHQLDAAGAPHHAVHVNIDGADLRERSMPDIVLGALQDGRIAPERIVLELTERDILHVDNHERSALAIIDAAGIHLAVDDFGTGYSSLSHLLDFPADHIKIDRRFVNDLPHDADSLALVRGVVSMANGLGLTTVAEGVETESAAATVRSLGCDQIQGYLIAPALASDAALTWWVGARSSTRSIA